MDLHTTETKFCLVEREIEHLSRLREFVWGIWFYKGIGYQSMIYLDLENPYMRLMKPFVDKKKRLAIDFWGCSDKGPINSEVYQLPIPNLKEMVPEHPQSKKIQTQAGTFTARASGPSVDF